MPQSTEDVEVKEVSEQKRFECERTSITLLEDHLNKRDADGWFLVQILPHSSPKHVTVVWDRGLIPDYED